MQSIFLLYTGIHPSLTARQVNQVEISTLINFSREMYTALKSLVFVLKDYLLEPGEADQFDNLPGFIR